MRDVVITGVGLVSCAGEGVDAHLQALGRPPRTDIETFAPFPAGLEEQMRGQARKIGLLAEAA